MQNQNQILLIFLMGLILFFGIVIRLSLRYRNKLNARGLNITSQQVLDAFPLALSNSKYLVFGTVYDISNYVMGMKIRDQNDQHIADVEFDGSGTLIICDGVKYQIITKLSGKKILIKFGDQNLSPLCTSTYSRQKIAFMIPDHSRIFAHRLRPKSSFLLAKDRKLFQEGEFVGIIDSTPGMPLGSGFAMQTKINLPVHFQVFLLLNAW